MLDASWFNKSIWKWGQNLNLTAFTSKIQIFCRPEWSQGGDLMKMSFDNFQMQN